MPFGATERNETQADTKHCCQLENRRAQALVGSNPTPSVIKPSRESGLEWSSESPRSNPRGRRQPAYRGFEPSDRSGWARSALAD